MDRQNTKSKPLKTFEGSLCSQEGLACFVLSWSYPSYKTLSMQGFQLRSVKSLAPQPGCQHWRQTFRLDLQRGFYLSCVVSKRESYLVSGLERQCLSIFLCARYTRYSYFLSLYTH